MFQWEIGYAPDLEEAMDQHRRRIEAAHEDLMRGVVDAENLDCFLVLLREQTLGTGEFSDETGWEEL